MGKSFFGQVGKLRLEKQEEYENLHRNPWPEILDAIRSCNIRNYSIFSRKGLLFAYFEYVGDDYDADMKKLSEYEICKKWWKITDPCFEKIDEDFKSKDFESMERIFHLD